MVMIITPLIGFAVSQSFKKQLKASFQEQMGAHIYGVLSVLEFENNQLQMPEALLEAKFNVIESGLYAFIFEQNNLVWQSLSSVMIDVNAFSPASRKSSSDIQVGDTLFEECWLDEEAYFCFDFSIRFEGEQDQRQVVLSIVKSQQDFFVQVKTFNQSLWLWLGLLLLLIGMLQALFLVWTIRPLNVFSRELQQIERGQREQISLAFPSELNKVAKGVNQVLSAQQAQKQRYRNSLSDLAHSLKTPLALIQSHPKLDTELSEYVKTIDNTISYQLTRASSSSNADWGVSTNVDQVLVKLINAFDKIYHTKELSIRYESDHNATFYGASEDLNELLGNLLDNACKAAHSAVIIVVSVIQERLVIRIEDDGMGLDEQQIAEIFKRGTRADTYQQGHGIGLAIVRDIMSAYQAKLNVERSERLGGAAFILEF